MGAPIEPLLLDLAAEHADLQSLVDGRTDDELVMATPAAGWTVVDQLSHLGGFDEAATLALRDPDAFRAELARMIDAGEDPIVGYTTRGRSMSPSDVARWWATARADLLSASRAADPSVRVPWFGPDMSTMSFVTARLMETWAHGVDIADTWSAPPGSSARLRHVCHIGVGARRYSYAVNGLDLPDGDIRVALIGPDDAEWVWGTSQIDVVSGDALDFALVVTQRRHLDDTSLAISGERAREWMGIAQAFAGGAGGGRAPRSAR